MTTQTSYSHPEGGTVQIDRGQARIIITTEGGSSAKLGIGPESVIELVQAMEQLGQAWLKEWRTQP